MRNREAAGSWIGAGPAEEEVAYQHGNLGCGRSQGEGVAYGKR